MVTTQLTERHADLLYAMIREAFAKADFASETKLDPPTDGSATFLRYPSYVPAGIYDEQWDWDAFFIGLAQLWLGDDDAVSRLQGLVKNSLDNQASDGRTPGCIPPNEHKKWRLEVLHHAKPVLAQAAYYASKAGDGAAWLRDTAEDGERYIEKLKKAVDYRETARLWSGKHGLAYWYNYIESGADDNVALDSPRIMADISKKDYEAYYTKSTAGIMAADVNAFLYRDYRALVAVLKQLGDASAGEYAQKAERLRENINTHLWHEQDQTYYNRRADDGAFITRHTYSNLLPLWAGIASQEQASAMIMRWMLQPDVFWSRYGIRSLAANDKDYNVSARTRPSNWQGPVWPHVNCLMVSALKRYGFAGEALELAMRTTELVLGDIVDNGLMHECYDGDTGKPLIIAGFVSWNVLVQHCIAHARADDDPFVIV